MIPARAIEPVRVGVADSQFRLFWSYTSRVLFIPGMHRNMALHYGNTETANYLVRRFVADRSPRAERMYFCSPNDFEPFREAHSVSGCKVVKRDIQEVIEGLYGDVQAVLAQCKHRKIVQPIKLFDIVHIHCSDEELRRAIGGHYGEKLLWLIQHGYRARVCVVLWVEQGDIEVDLSRFFSVLCYMGEQNQKLIRTLSDKELSYARVSKEVAGYMVSDDLRYLMQLHLITKDNINEFGKARKRYYESRSQVYRDFLGELDNGTETI